MSHTRGTVLFALALTAAAPTAAQPTLEPGTWAIKTASVVNGQAAPADRQELCLQEELKDLVGYFTPKLEGVRAQCKATRQPAKGNTLSHRLECKGANFTSDVRTSVTVESPRRFKSSMKVDTRNKGRPPYVATAETEAEWIGPCRKQ